MPIAIHNTMVLVPLEGLGVISPILWSTATKEVLVPFEGLGDVFHEEPLWTDRRSRSPRGVRRIWRV